MFNSNTMFHKINIYFLLLLCGYGYAIKNCNDCKFIHECSNAAEALKNSEDPKIIEMFNEAFCGVFRLHKIQKPKFCCSHFPGVDSRIKDHDKINSHDNLALLPDDCGPVYFKDRIVGGTYADMYEFPWMALIGVTRGTKKGLDYNCAGTIINQRYILTAAHCVKANTVEVRLGEYNIDKNTDCQGKYENYVCEKHLQNIEIENKIIHPSFNRTRTSAKANDIALLRLKNPIDLTNHRNVKPVCLPVFKELRETNINGENAVVTGWGRTSSYNMRKNYSPILQKVEIPIWSDTECRSHMSYGQNVTSERLCAGVNGKDSCNGDSGGPLMLIKNYGDKHRTVQFGVVSNGPNPCGSSKPGVYTDVAKHIGWILDNIQE